MDLADKLQDGARRRQAPDPWSAGRFRMSVSNGLPGAVSGCPSGESGRPGNRPAGLMLAVALLITPSMTHQIAYRGEDRRGALRVASTCAGLAGVPMTLGLGATTFVVFESLFNRNMGVVAGITFAAAAFSFLYALGLVLRIGHTGQMPPSEKQTLLKNKIEQLLTEARSSFLALRPCWGSSSSWFSCGLLASCPVGLKSPMPSPWRPLPCRSFC